MLLSSGYDKLYPKEDKEDGLDPAAAKEQESIPNREKALHMAAAMDEENKMQVGRDNE